MNAKNINSLIYAFVFQVGWFVCILGGDFYSILYAVAFLLFHFWLLYKQSNLLPKEANWLVSVFTLGMIIETITFSLELLSSPDSVSVFNFLVLPPLWLISLWVMFAIALRTCLYFLFNKPVLAYLLLLITIPLNYYSGAKLNEEVNILKPYSLSLSLITFFWLIFFWCLTMLKRHYFEDIENAH